MALAIFLSSGIRETQVIISIKQKHSDICLILDTLITCKKCKGLQGQSIFPLTILYKNIFLKLAPRSYHCHKCGRCVLKMNHHCAWLNVCIGHYNQAQYLMYLSSSLASSLLSVFTLYQGLQRSVKLKWRHFSFFYFSYHRYYEQWDEDKQHLNKEIIVISTPELWNFNFSLGLSSGLSMVLIYFLLRQVGTYLIDSRSKKSSTFLQPL